MNNMLLFILFEITLIEILALAVLYVIYSRKNTSKKKISEYSSKQPEFKSIRITEQGIKQKAPKKPLKLPNPKNLKHLGWHQWVIIGIYAIIIIFIAYIVMANLAPESTPGTQSGNYEISASGLIPYSSEMRSFYIDKDNALGKKAGTENDVYRSIAIEEPFNLVLKPKKIIAPNTKADLKINFQNFGTDLYLNEKLAIPNLENYTKVRTFSGEKTSVWVKEDLEKSSHEEADNANNAKDFIYRNYPNTDYYSFKELEGGIPVIADYEKTTTKIDTTFRGGLKLAVYTENILNIEFTKQDMNSYVGKDEYTVKITNLQGDLIHEETFEDDGVKKDTGEDNPQDFELELKGLKRNIYYVEFILDDKNKYDDSTLKNIEINSNKVVLPINRIRVLNQFDFYKKVRKSSKISFRFGHDSYQKIEQTGTEDETIDLDEDWKGEKYNQDLTKGEYNFHIPKGDMHIYNTIVSPEKENWFNIPQSGKDRIIDSDIIVIDNEYLEFNEHTKEGTYSKEIDLDEEETKTKMQVLDKDKVYINKFELTLRD